jgi:hypothetical protein
LTEREKGEGARRKREIGRREKVEGGERERERESDCFTI